LPTLLLSSRHANVLLLTLDSDDGFPRLERSVLADLAKEITALRSTDDLLGAVITGTSRAFAAGAEIAEIAVLSASEAYEFARNGQRVFNLVEQSRKPIVAAIRGYCMGGALDLALACHARIAAPDALFANPGGSIGIMTGWGGTQRLPRLIGRSRALEMFVTACRLDAPEALECGLVNTIVQPGDLITAAIARAAPSPR
jgi:enoyl-CoA hydratase/carnithine racemase